MWNPKQLFYRILNKETHQIENVCYVGGSRWTARCSDEALLLNWHA